MRDSSCPCGIGETIGAPASSFPAPSLRPPADSLRTTARDGTGDRRAATPPSQRRPTRGRRQVALAAVPSEADPAPLAWDHVSSGTVYSLAAVQLARQAG